MKKILILTAYYYPGFRSGGPQQSIMNMVEIFGNKCDFYILTHNHDLGIEKPYRNIQSDTWLEVGKAKVYYCSNNIYSFKFLKSFDGFDKIYLCEPYQMHSYKILLLNRINSQIYLATMGCFSKGAISKKKFKKKIFWITFKTLGLYKNIKWSFSSEFEKKDAIRVIGKKYIQEYLIAEDLPRKFLDLSEIKNTEKKKGYIKIVFLSRICEMKNLLQLITEVSKVKGNIIFDIYGTIEDKKYWNKCEKMLNKLPNNIVWKYKGTVESKDVLNVLVHYDIFCLPTLGENFGHVIYEALVAGCIPIISDRTPWNDLDDNHCGNIIPLKNKSMFVSILQRYIDMSSQEITYYQKKAMLYAEKKYKESVLKSGYRKLIEEES